MRGSTQHTLAETKPRCGNGCAERRWEAHPGRTSGFLSADTTFGRDVVVEPFVGSEAACR